MPHKYVNISVIIDDIGINKSIYTLIYAKYYEKYDYKLS